MQLQIGYMKTKVAWNDEVLIIDGLGHVRPGHRWRHRGYCLQSIRRGHRGRGGEEREGVRNRYKWDKKKWEERKRKKRVEFGRKLTLNRCCSGAVLKRLHCDERPGQVINVGRAAGVPSLREGVGVRNIGSSCWSSQEKITIHLRVTQPKWAANVALSPTLFRALLCSNMIRAVWQEHGKTLLSHPTKPTFRWKTISSIREPLFWQSYGRASVDRAERTDRGVE